MKLAKESHRELELFFREYFGDENLNLPEIHIYCGKFTGAFINIIKVHGITFGRRIFIWPELINFDPHKKGISCQLAAHEATHVIQYHKHGLVGFLYKYLKNYWKNLQTKPIWDLDARQEAYRQIEFEIEARDAAEKFYQWLPRHKKNNHPDNHPGTGN